MKKDRFFIYYSGLGKVTSPKVSGINYDGYLHNSTQKRMSFLFSNEDEKGNFIRDFQKANPNLKIARTHVQKMSSSSQPSQPSRTSSETSKKSEVKREESSEVRKEESGGNENILLILAVGAGAFLFLGKGKKKRK
ncbi:MAG: hypothetical protein L6Q54_15605 [Leptospiraceae bacterium]|nr:hypothetical protein [Leptospiraceae bacterium]NUM42855.1 hypothetical protein [Leptospiraceae bacterium]